MKENISFTTKTFTIEYFFKQYFYVNLFLTVAKVNLQLKNDQKWYFNNDDFYFQLLCSLTTSAWSSSLQQHAHAHPRAGRQQGLGDQQAHAHAHAPANLGQPKRVTLNRDGRQIEVTIFVIPFCTRWWFLYWCHQALKTLLCCLAWVKTLGG